MTLIHNNSLALRLHLLSAHLQRTNKTYLLLTLGLHSNDGTSLKRVLSIRQRATGGCQTRGHECGAGEHEADSTTVDLDGWEGGGEGVDELEVGNWRAVEGLEEEGGGVYCVEGNAVGTVGLFC